MSCPFSTSEVFLKVGCNQKIDGIVKCPFINDCNVSPIWDVVSDDIRKGIETYEKAIKDGAVFYSNKPIEDIVLETRIDTIDECVKEINCEFYENVIKRLEKLKEDKQ